MSEPPQGLRVEHDDGTVMPLECLYGGVDAEGMHQWRVVTPFRPVPGRDRICIDVLPAKTRVLFPWEDR